MTTQNEERETSNETVVCILVLALVLYSLSLTLANVSPQSARKRTTVVFEEVGRERNEMSCLSSSSRVKLCGKKQVVRFRFFFVFLNGYKTERRKKDTHNKPPRRKMILNKTHRKKCPKIFRCIITVRSSILHYAEQSK